MKEWVSVLHLQALQGAVAAAVVDRDADGGRQLDGNARLLQGANSRAQESSFVMAATVGWGSMGPGAPESIWQPLPKRLCQVLLVVASRQARQATARSLSVRLPPAARRFPKVPVTSVT